MGLLTIALLLDSLRQRGVEITVDAGQLRVRAPRGELLPEEREEIARQKASLVSLLEEEKASRSLQWGKQLSLQQERLWYLDRVEGGLPAYNLSGAFEMDGALDAEVLRKALKAFLERHELLRAVVREESGEPRLDLTGPAILSFRQRTLKEVVGESGTEDDLRRWLEGEADQLLPLHRPPLIHFTLIRVSADRHILFLLVHHLVWDGRCFDIFLRDVGDFYLATLEEREATLAPIEGRYSDFVAWQRAQLSGPRLLRAMEFWDDVLGGAEQQVLDLPLDRPRPPLMTYEGSRVPIRLEGRAFAALKSLAREEQGTLFPLLLTAFKVLLYRFSDQKDLVVASPIEGRPLPAFEEMAGFFVNTLLIRSTPSGELPFREFYHQVKEQFLQSVAFQDTPFEWLVQRYAARDPSRTALFQAMFTHQYTAGRTGTWGSVRVRSFLRDTRSTNTDLSLWVREYETYIDGGFDFRVDLFDRESIEGMVHAFYHLIDAIVGNPDRKLENLSLLDSEAEKRETSGRSGVTESVLPKGSYLQMIRAHVEKGPGRDAVRRADGGWTSRAELWEAAGRVAGSLLERGVEKGDVVAVAVERSAALVPLLLGIHRAGAVYLPLDPDFPQARLEYMIGDSGAQIVVVQSGHTGAGAQGEPGWTAAAGTRIVTVEEAMHWDGPNAQPDERQPTEQDLAYLMYTSGSTGEPKAVEVEHGALVNFLRSVEKVLGVDERDTLVAITTVSFDISLLELLLPVCSGGRLAVADTGTTRDPRALERLMVRSGATVMQATPATWQMLIGEGWNGTLRMILCGGETLPRKLADRLLDRSRKVWNLYGPTETTIWSTAARVIPEQGAVAIGKPLHNTRVYVLDDRRRPVPAGVRGEIWIGGSGLARGYRARPRLSSERFVADPFFTDGRMYRTGDLGRWRTDGRLEHLGRMDHQVKVLGFRIELGEIETALERMKEVKRAVVDARGSDQSKRLVAYLNFEPGHSLMGSEIRRRLARTLPNYMLPGLVMEIDSIPLTPNGKVDRSALPDPESRISAERSFAEPMPGIEATIAAVWRELLEIEKVGRHDNFFELGGHSLLSIRAAVGIEDRTGRSVDPRNFFFQTLAQLADGYQDT